MIVQHFSVAAPDSDGDMPGQLSVAGENTTEHEVRLIRLIACFRTAEGRLFSEANHDEEVRLEPGEDYVTSIQTGWLKAGFGGNDPQDVKCEISATLYRREMFRLGEMPVPGKAGALGRLEKTIDSSCLGKDVSVLVLREKLGDEGKVALQLRCGLVNPTDNHIEHLALKAELLDDDDAVIESDLTTMAMAPGVTRVFESQMWGLSAAKLKRARLKFMLYAYLAVARDTCQGTSSPE